MPKTKIQSEAPPSIQPVTAVGQAKIGRPMKAPPTDAAEQIAAKAADGFSMRGIAVSIGTSFETLQRWFGEHPELKEAFEAGREKERQTLHNVLYKLAVEEKDKIAAMFLLKARHGYREGDQGETANRVTINFQMPGAMPLASFVKASDDSAT